MKVSITNKKQLYSFLLLLVLWQVSASVQEERVFFPSFLEVIQEGVLLVQEGSFWKILSLTFFRVFLGFSLCFSLAFLLAILSFWKENLEIVWTALFQIFRILPSVVMIILLLIFVPISWISISIQLCVVLPLLYEQSLKSLQGISGEYREILYYYDVALWKRCFYVYFPVVFQNLLKNMESILGLCIKVTIAGELLAQEEESIGGEIFIQKMYLNIPRVLAWCLLLLLLHSLLALCIRKLGKKR